jgi:hypothetical protein
VTSPQGLKKYRAGPGFVGYICLWTLDISHMLSSQRVCVCFFAVSKLQHKAPRYIESGQAAKEKVGLVI